MNILILSNSHPHKDAGIIANDILNSFRFENKNAVKLIVREWDNYNDSDIIPADNIITFNIRRLIRNGFTFLKKIGFLNKESLKTDREYSIDDFDQTKTFYSTKRILKKIGFKPDIVIILFSQKFLSFRNYYEFHKYAKIPIFLYMMDMAPITGGCHYAWDCKGYLKKCGQCPALYSKDPFDQTYANWKFKKQFIDQTDIRVIAGSEWSYRQLLNSSLFKDKLKYKCLLPINEIIYKPENMSVIRNQLGLPPDKKIIFIGAVSIMSKRKGITKLLEALLILKKDLSINHDNIHISIAGKLPNDLNLSLPFASTTIGYLSHTILPKAFQAADLFVSASIEDSGPMMVNQSIMCGTPVVSFEMGVALDLVHSGKTGYRARLNDSEDLAYGIKYILKLGEQEYKKIVIQCRETGLNLCQPNRKAAELLHIFKEQ